MRPSYTWKSIFGVKWLVEKGVRWVVDNENKINVWSSVWLPRLPSFKVITPIVDNDPKMRLCDLLVRNGQSWNEELVRNVFLLIDNELILNIPLGLGDHVDELT